MLRRQLKPFFYAFVLATFCALAVRLFFVEDFRISSDSMAPNLLPGDLVFVYKPEFNLRLPFSSLELIRFRRPRRSEVVAFSLPGRGLETFVKRVIGIEGDRVELRKGVLYINGQIENEAYRLKRASSYEKDYGPVEVPAGYFFALGDNRSESIDSRTWGPVPYSCLKGLVKVVWLSLNSTGRVRNERVGLRVN